MSSLFWKTISFVFHPLLLITYAYLLLFYGFTYYKARFYEETPGILVFYVFSNTFLLPSLAVLIMKKMGLIKTLTLDNRKERTLPYFLTVIFCVVTTYHLYQSQLGDLSYRFMLGVSVTLLCVTLINLQFKISAHASGGGGLIALLFYFVFIGNDPNMVFWLVLSIPMMGLSASSRVYLGVHTRPEIYYGFLLGFSVVFISLAV